MLGEVLAVAAGYVLGTIPTAAWIGRRTGHDPIFEGSHNPGATNVYRISGRRAGAVVLAVDVAKGALATGLGLAVGGRTIGLAAGAAAVVGHVLPVTRRFHGGKGVATAAGMAAVLYPLLAVVLVAVFLAVVALTHRVSAGSLALAVLLPMGVALGGHGWAQTLVVTGVSGLVIARHHDNIRRLIRGEEAAMAPLQAPEERTP
jgi:acyl phosphate:glycerol-3-phosphate acyltransferase